MNERGEEEENPPSVINNDDDEIIVLDNEERRDRNPPSRNPSTLSSSSSSGSLLLNQFVGELNPIGSLPLITNELISQILPSSSSIPSSQSANITPPTTSDASNSISYNTSNTSSISNTPSNSTISNTTINSTISNTTNNSNISNSTNSNSITNSSLNSTSNISSNRTNTDSNSTTTNSTFNSSSSSSTRIRNPSPSSIPSSSTSNSGKAKRKSDTTLLNDDNKENSAKKTKQDNQEDDEEGSSCTICFEPWTNSGEHRIASLKCGHFFGYNCIERWLKGNLRTSSCPNCNEKASRKEIRLHFVARLKAIDTSEKDRALSNLEQFKIKYRTLELEHTTLKLTSKLQKEENERLQKEIAKLYSSASSTGGNSKSSISDTTSASNAASTSSSSGSSSSTSTATSSFVNRLTYYKKLELIKETNLNNPSNKFSGIGCRVMAFDPNQAMLVVSIPSYTALAPGFGVKRINMLEMNSNSFVALHKEPIRDLAFNPSNNHQLLSVSQDKTIKLMNINSCSELMKYHCESEVWSCAWNHDSPYEFFVGTKRSQIMLFDTRSSTANEPKQILTFPIVERRPIIGLSYVPECPRHAEFPIGGLLVLTLGSVWFFQRTHESNGGDVSYVPYKLPITGLFWSIRFDIHSRMVLISTKPSPQSRHIVANLTRVDLSDGNFTVSASIMMESSNCGSYSEKSFLRSTLFPRSNGNDVTNVLCAYSKGSGGSNHKTVIQEVGSDRIIQELPVRKPVLDIWSCNVNDISYLSLLTETELFIYKWT